MDPQNSTLVLTRNMHRLERIEAVVSLTALLMAFLVVFGSFRRRYHHWMFKFSVWTAYVVSAYLISYTMGMMQSAPFQNELFTVWALFLVIVLGSADTISAYSLEDNESRKRYNWEIIVQFFWMGWLLGMNEKETSFKVPLVILFIVSLMKTNERALALKSASKSFGLVRNTKLVADFMGYEHELGKEGEVLDPTCMKGYRYLVRGEDEEEVKVLPPLYQKRLTITDKAITIEQIWQCKGRILSSTGDPDGRVKDICLSFALFRLLCCRFAGYPLYDCDESQVKAWNFVRNGLLSKEGDYERAFRVIEVELAFLYDFFYTKYPVIFRKEYMILGIIRTVLVIYCCLQAAVILSNYHSPYGNLSHVTSSGHNVDVLVTGIVIAAVLFMEVAQFFFMFFSDWAKVMWICKYVKRSSWQKNKGIDKILGFVCHRQLVKPWEKKLGQYSLFQSFHHNPSKIKYNFLSTDFIDKPTKGQKESTRIKLSVEVKEAIILSLNTNGGRLTNGVASLQRNGVENELSWACSLETQTHVILVWHIATSLCDIALSQESTSQEQANQQRKRKDFIVADSLSKYCAYLVAISPKFLPDHAYTTEFIFEQVVLEAREVLGGHKSTNRLEKMMTLAEGNPDETTIKRGAVLGKKLIEEIRDQERIWKILADLWAEIMLFVAPSDDATAHAEYLASGGEFVTHLWALLSHAGILKRDSAVQDV